MQIHLWIMTWKGSKILDVEKNRLLAKKYMVENIYNAANIEGIAVTFPETQTICDGISIAGKSIDDINAVCDLKKAYQWILNHYTNPINLSTIKTINRILGKYTVINAGQIRDEYSEPIRVKVNHGYYYPPLPKPDVFLEQDIVDIMNRDGIDRYLELFCYLCKSQLFGDGNKRTATLTTEMAMIQQGDGFFSVPAENRLEFYQFLADYYEDERKKEDLKKFLKQSSVFFYDFMQERNTNEWEQEGREQP